MTDCLILGYNDVDFAKYEAMVRAMGVHTGAYRDLNLAFVEHEGKPYRALDMFFDLYHGDRPKPERPWNNADYMWLVVTYLGTYLQRRGYSFDYVSLPHFEREKLREKLLDDDLLTIAITTTLYVAPHPILDLVQFIRRYNQKAKIVIGGPYISGQASALEWKDLKDHFRYLGGDIYVISSEGEHALTQVIDCLKGGGDLAAVDNLAFRQGRDFVRTNATPESNPLEENMVQWSLFPGDELGQFVTLRTAKSCPFACAFCGFPQRAGAYKYLSVELFEQELNAINDLGSVSTLSIIDDTFNVPKPRFKELMRMMIRNRYDFKWNCYYRSDHGDDEAIELMGRAGCEGVLLGVESGSDKILKNMNKSARRKDYLRAIPLLQAAGVSCYASLIIGFPGDTFETVEESLGLLEEAKPDYYRTQLWYCDPITPIFQQKEKYGIHGEGFNWRHDTMDVDTACDLIDRSFLAVENSVWMPQYGFEQWSTFYMKRKGMTMEQVKDSVRCWNAMIKDKLLHPGREEIRPELLRALEESLRVIDEPAARPDLEVIAPLSGAGYRAAERFWAEEFGGAPPAAPLALIGRDLESNAWTTARVALDPAAVEGAAASLGAEPSDVLLGAYGALLSWLGGAEDAAAVAVASAAPDEARALPLRLRTSVKASFREHVAEMRARMAAAEPRRLWAFHLLTNPYRLGYYGAVPPVFEAGYVFAESQEAEAGGSLEKALADHPPVKEGLKLILEAGRHESGLWVTLSSRFGSEVTERLGASFASILAAVAADPEAPLGQASAGSEPVGFSPIVDELSREAFHFN